MIGGHRDGGQSSNRSRHETEIGERIARSQVNGNKEMTCMRGRQGASLQCRSPVPAVAEPKAVVLGPDRVEHSDQPAPAAAGQRKLGHHLAGRFRRVVQGFRAKSVKAVTTLEEASDNTSTGVYITRRGSDKRN